jgi:hypothetical protein
MLRAMWELNKMPDIGDEQGDDSIFVWGLGFINLIHIELEP